MAVRYQLLRDGVLDRDTGRKLTRLGNQNEWIDYIRWLGSNVPDPMDPPPVPVPTQEEIDAQAEIDARQTIRGQLRLDSAIQALRNRTPAQADAWIDANVTTLAEARTVLKNLGSDTRLIGAGTIVNEFEHKESSVWQAAVTLGHLAIAIGGILLTLGGLLVVSERRITQIEERQAFVLRYITQDAQDASAVRNDLIRRLETLSAQIARMEIELAKHQAASEVRRSMREEEANGVRIPKFSPGIGK